MEDPERLLSATSEADALEREVLTSLRNVKAPAHAHEAAWRGIAAGIALTTVSTATQTTATANASLSGSAKGALGGLTKYLLVVALGGAAVGGGSYGSLRHHAAQPAGAVRAHAVMPLVVAPKPAPVISVPAQATPAEPATPSQVPSVATFPRPASHAKENELLAAESSLLASARSELRNGEIPTAQRALNRLRSRFPHGALVQERDVLGIELLSARGDSAGAKRAARAFVVRYPNSPHSTQLRMLLATP